MHPQVRLHLVRDREAELARAAERSRRWRESRHVKVRRPVGRGDPTDV
jgi:hypothetical protein